MSSTTLTSITHPRSADDAARLVAIGPSVRGAVDTGRVLLSLEAERRRAPAFATTPFAVGSLAGDWVAAPGTAADGTILYLHSRRFQFDEPPEVLAGALSAATGWSVLLLHYRVGPAHPYPAALDDTLMAYGALLEQGIPADRMVVVGHSAGATLALQAVLRLCRDRAPLPAAVATVSPITDFTFSGATYVSNVHRDLVSEAEIRESREVFLGGLDPSGEVSPLTGVGPGLPPLMMACGSDELLLDDTVRFAEAAVAAGNDVTLEIFEGMPHGWPVLDLDGADLLLARLATFTTRHLAGPAVGADCSPSRLGRLRDHR